MIDLCICTTSPKALSDALVSLGLVKLDATSKTGVTGLLPGTEIVQVPNPVIVTPAVLDKNGNVTAPAVMDARYVYLVRLAHEAAADQVKNAPAPVKDAPPTAEFDKAAAVVNIKATATADKVGTANAYKSGANFWLIDPAQAGKFGCWQ